MFEAILCAIDVAKGHCSRVLRSNPEDLAAYQWIDELLTSLQTRLAVEDMPSNYLHEFPIGNLLVRRLSAKADQELVVSLRAVDDLMLSASRNPEYQQFLRDFNKPID